MCITCNKMRIANHVSTCKRICQRVKQKHVSITC
nr:MAG TPA: hypothetical protein [Caudoviricetes sp.]